MSDPVPEFERPCCKVDDLSGAVCTEKYGHQAPHRDGSDPSVEIMFRDPVKGSWFAMNPEGERKEPQVGWFGIPIE